MARCKVIKIKKEIEVDGVGLELTMKEAVDNIWLLLVC